MPGQRLPMRKIRDVLRLHAGGMSKRKVAASLLIGATAAGDCVRRARRTGLSWPLPENLSDEALERLLYPPPLVAAKDRRARPDWVAIHRELRRPGVTLALLWEEHRGAHPDGYGYSRYCELYRAWEGRLSPTMRQTHVAGERMFVDYAGTTLEVVDGTTGEVRDCQLFVATLGASNYTYAEDHLYAAPCRLDRLAHAGLHVFRRGHGADCLRQSEIGHYQGVLLRAGGQPHLCGDGGSLRHGRRSGASKEATRQGQGGSGGAGGDPLDHRQAAPSAILR